jgi:hypothetical protein
MADDYGCFGSDTPEQQRAHDAVHDEYEDGEYWVERGALVDNEPYNVMDISPHDGAGVAGYWVEKFAYEELQFMLRFEQELIELGLFENSSSTSSGSSGSSGSTSSTSSTRDSVDWTAACVAWARQFEETDEAEAERPQVLFALLGSGPGQSRRFPVILSQAPRMRPNRRLQHGRPWSHVYLDSGPFYADACQVLRNTGTQLWTCDGSPHAANYRHSRERYEDQVADVALLPEALMDENGEPNDDVVTVYRLHLEDVEE